MDIAAFTGLFHQVTEAVAGAQTEIVIFILAFFIHGLVFGRLPLSLRSRRPPRSSKVPASPNLPFGGKPAPLRSFHAKDLPCDESSEAACCALIKRSENAPETVRIFTLATRGLQAPCSILVAALDWALEHSDESVAKLVLDSLPTKPPGEAVGKLLRFYSNAHGTAFELYVEKFKDLDLSADMDAMRLITLLTLQQGGQLGKQALAGLLAAVSQTSRVSLLKAFAAEKELAAALEVLRASPGKASCLYNAAIDVCIDCGNIDAAEEVMQEAVAHGIADTTLYNTIVRAYAQARRPHDVRQAVAAMRAAGLVPNSVTYNYLLDAVVKNGLEEAWQVLAVMRNAGLHPNHITCSILLKAVQARTKPADFERVIETTEKIEAELDEALLSSVIDACIRAHRAELLIPILKRQRSNVKTTVKCAHTYGSIIRAYGSVHDIAGVWETWREIRSRHIAPNAVALGCMTEALTQNGEAEGAYELINEVRKDEKWAPLINAVIYCSVLKGFSRQKRFDRLWAVYEEMLGHKLQFSIVTFNTLVDACSRNKEMSRIPALLTDMVAQGIQPNIITFSAIVKGYCQEDRIAEAFSVVDGMRQTTDIVPDEIMFNTLLDGCARQRMYERGMGVLEVRARQYACEVQGS